MKTTVRLLTLLGVLVLVPFAMAGVYLEQVVKSDPVTVMGKTQPARETVQKIFLADDRMASENSDGMSVIVRLDQKKIYFINTQGKSYQVSDLPLKFPPEMQQMMAAFQFTTDIQKTGNRKQVGAYNCEEVVMTLKGFMNFTIRMWCTGDIRMPFDKYYAMSAEMVAYSPAIKQMMEKMRSLGNLYAVEQEMTGEVMGTKTRSVTKLVNFDANASIPADKFNPPANFKQEPLDFQKMMQRQ